MPKFVTVTFFAFEAAGAHRAAPTKIAYFRTDARLPVGLLPLARFVLYQTLAAYGPGSQVPERR